MTRCTLDGKLTYYMKTITVSATHARNNFFELLGMVETGKQIIVKKDKKEVAIISPRKKKKRWMRYAESGRKKIIKIGRKVLRGKALDRFF